jgi:PQQ-like domain
MGARPRVIATPGWAQINRSNVQNLRVAWTYNTGDTAGGIQAQPLIIDRRMFVHSATRKIAALDAVTGKVLWNFDPGLQDGLPSRGFSYWTDCKQKILFAGVLYNLWALDPETGKPIATFGDGGKIDLRDDLGPESPKSPRCAAISVPMMCIAANCAGGFIPFPTRASPAAKPGRRTHGSTPVPPTTGRAWRWMRNEASCTPQPARQYRISMAPTAPAMTFMQIRFWRSMAIRAN